MITFFVFLFCLFATYAVYLVAARKAVEQRAQMKQRISEVLAYSSGVDEEQLKLAREELLSEIPLMHKLLIRVRSVTQVKRMIDQADLQLTVMRLFMFSGLAGLLAVLTVSTVSVNLLLILAGGAAATVIPFLHVIHKRQQRFDKFLADLPEALDLMARAGRRACLHRSHEHGCQRNAGTDFKGISTNLRRAKPGTVVQAGIAKPGRTHSADGSAIVYDSDHDSARNGRKPGGNSGKGFSHHSRTIPDYGRSEDADNSIANFRLGVMRSSHFYHHCRQPYESRLHEHSVGRPARS